MSSPLQRQNASYQFNSNAQFFRYGYRTNWQNFVKIAMLSAIPILLLSYFFPYLSFILVYWFIAFLIWGIWRFKRMKKIQKLDQFNLPDNIWIAFRQKYPQFHVINQPFVEESFKDYLALHIIKNQSYAMPSHAVDALWHLLLEQFPEFYMQMCQNILGFELLHKPHQTAPNRMQKNIQNQQLLNTWVVSCSLYRLDQQQPKDIPRLFLADQVSAWERGITFNMVVITTLFQHIHSQGRSTISSCSSATSSFSDISNTASSSTTDSDQSHQSDSDSSSPCSSCSSCGSSD